MSDREKVLLIQEQMQLVPKMNLDKTFLFKNFLFKQEPSVQQSVPSGRVPPYSELKMESPQFLRSLQPQPLGVARITFKCFFLLKPSQFKHWGKTFMETFNHSISQKIHLNIISILMICDPLYTDDLIHCIS